MVGPGPGAAGRESEPVAAEHEISGLGLERELYEHALRVLRDACCEPVSAYNEQKVELAKWIICNIWGPTE